MNIDDELDKLRAAREEAEMLSKLEAIGWNKVNGSIMGCLKSFKNIRNEELKLAALRKDAEKNERIIAELKLKAQQTGRALNQQEQELLDKTEEAAKFAKDYADSHEKTLMSMKSQLNIGEALKNTVWTGMQAITAKIWQEVATMPGFLNDADKALRKMTLSMGASGNNAERMRDSTLAAAQYAAQFGETVADLAHMQLLYTDATGKANTLSASSAKSVTQMAAGTSLGKDAAAEMAGSFAIIGLNAERVAELTETLTNDAEALGLNAKSVLKTINANFAKSQGYTFKDGAAGLKTMAIQAQNLKVSMEDTFAAADKARTLEGSLEMAAQLMVMGGNFSKADPFKLSFLARNDPAKFQKALGDMTKGIATFNRETGELSISAYDMDRLRAVSEATGESMKSLTDSAKNFAQVDMAKRSMVTGSDEDKEMIANMAEMKKDGTFKIDVGGSAVELSKLTGEQVGLLKAQKQTLEQRAEDAKSLDEAFKNFVLELKTTLKPMINALTWILTKVKSVMEGLRNYGLGIVTGGLLLFAAGVTIYKGIGLLKGMGSVIGALKGGAPSVGSSIGGGGGGGGGILNGLGSGGMASAATIAAIGVAAVGLGYGLKLAAEGVATLAQAMKGMTGGEMAGLLGVVLGLGAAFVGFGFAMSTALTAIGANPAAWAGIAALGAISLSMVGIGFAVKMATDGIGNMMTSIGGLGNVDLSGLSTFFGQMANFMEGKTTNFDKLQETVKYLEDSEKSVVSEINKAFSQPIKMVLSGDTTLSCNIEIHNNIDGDKMTSKFAKKFQVAIMDATKGMRSL